MRIVRRIPVINGFRIRGVFWDWDGMGNPTLRHPFVLRCFDVVPCNLVRPRASGTAHLSKDRTEIELCPLTRVLHLRRRRLPRDGRFPCQQGRGSHFQPEHRGGVPALGDGALHHGPRGRTTRQTIIW